MPYLRARLLRSWKINDEMGNIEEVKVWAVPKSPRQPEGIRYRLAYVLKGRGKPAVLYDNHHPKGHHKHLGSREFPYDYAGLDKLLEDFRRDVEALK